MTGYRNRPRRDFTILRNAAIRDPSLSLKAKGMLALMLSYPDDWTYHLTHLEGLSADGRDATRAAVRELEAAGYVTRRQTRDEGGRLAHAEYMVADTVDGLSVDGSTGDGSPVDGKPATTKTEGTKTEATKTDDTNPLPPPDDAPEVDALMDVVEEQGNQERIRRHSTHDRAVLASQHPSVWRNLAAVSSARGWKAEQLQAVAVRVLQLTRDHGDDRVAAALQDVRENLDAIRYPMRYLDVALTRSAAQAEAQTSGQDLIEALL